MHKTHRADGEEVICPENSVLNMSELGEVMEAVYKENHSGHGVPDGLHWGATGGMKTG